MLHPIIPIPNIGNIVSATNFDVVEKVSKVDVKVLTEFKLMDNAMDDFYIAFGQNLKTNHIESLVYCYLPTEGYDEKIGFPIVFGGASEENFTEEQWLAIATQYPNLKPKY